jgi:AraC-like DNA-binding protein
MSALAANRTEPDFFSPHVLTARRFYLDLKPPRGRRLAVVCGGCESCSPDYAVERKNFPFYSIEYVARGGGELRLKHRRHTLEPGRLFSYGPGVPHRISGDPANPLVKYFVDFTGTEALALLRACKMPPGTASRVFPPGEIQGLFDELVASGIKGTKHSADLCAKLLACLGVKIEDSRAPLEGPAALSFTTYQQCRQHIQEQFIRLKTLRQIADECHLDGAYLCRLFQRYGHESPYQFLLRLKINRAAEWLQQPGALVKQVAEQAGFADPFHFSRTFKSVLGLSPDQFRRLR